MDKKVLIGIGMVVVIGAVLGLGVAGVIPIPGLTKKAKPPVADEQKDETKDETKADPPKQNSVTKNDPKKPNATIKTPPGPTPEDLARGYKKLAGVWAEMSPADVGKLLIDHYKPEDAAPILKLMDEDQVAAIFTALSKTSADSPATIAPGAPAPLTKAKDNATANYCDALAKEVSKPAPAEATKS